MTAIPAVWPVPRVGIIGVGNMGGAMAARLLGQSYLVAVHDIDAQREAQAVSLGAMAWAQRAAHARGDRAVERVSVGEQAMAVFARACENGLATLDDASVFELMRKR